MANTPDSAACLEDGERTLTPISPFLGLNYHFGMLLGVDDFSTEQAYHRGKIRLHNAWLHREGVVWGLEVRLDTPKSEVRVRPGFALDGAGHELRLEAEACVALGAWFAEHREDADFSVEAEGDEVRFDAYVTIAHKACLTRQVPALSEPCDAARTDTAYSRVFETVELRLVPGRAPQPPPPPYHGLRVLFGLDVARTLEDGTVEPGDQEILDARAAVAALPREQQRQAWLDLFRRTAAADEIALAPATDPDTGEALLFPTPEREPVVLAELRGIVLEKTGDGWTASGGTVSNDVRPSHVATRTIQELLCACLHNPASPLADAGGPRIDRASVAVNGVEISFTVDRDLHEASVRPAAFAVSSFDDATGWQRATIDEAEYDAATKTTTLTLDEALGGELQRVIAFGTGDSPLLGADLVPLAGATGDPAAIAYNGRDFVYMRKVS
ncbi:MAG TPA: SwmB domain-containing protein [Gammaproteobacteria bacterium]|nr:SwmB domain-containing protein [Gammaproteobacteria bacterium]